MVAFALAKFAAKKVAGRGAKMAAKRGAGGMARRGAGGMARRRAGGMARRATAGGVGATMERAQKAQNMYGQAQQMRGVMGGGATVAPMNMGSQIPMAQPGGTMNYEQMAPAPPAPRSNTMLYVAGGIMACLVLMATVMFVRNRRKKDE
jgi:hypothetical protein